jgi:hypothetical protein
MMKQDSLSMAAFLFRFKCPQCPILWDRFKEYEYVPNRDEQLRRPFGLAALAGASTFMLLAGAAVGFWWSGRSTNISSNVTENAVNSVRARHSAQFAENHYRLFPRDPRDVAQVTASLDKAGHPRGAVRGIAVPALIGATGILCALVLTGAVFVRYGLDVHSAHELVVYMRELAPRIVSKTANELGIDYERKNDDDDLLNDLLAAQSEGEADVDDLVDQFLRVNEDEPSQSD